MTEPAKAVFLSYASQDAEAARRVPEEAWERRQRAVERDIVVIYGQPEELERAEAVLLLAG